MPDYMFGDAVNEYLNSRKFRGLAWNTKRIYSNGIATLEPIFGKYTLDAITRSMVIKLRDRFYDQPGKCKTAIGTLNNILKLAYDHGLVDNNVAASVGDMPAIGRIDRWSMDEIENFMHCAPQHLIDAMLVALYTGQRRSDLVRMKWTDYDEETGLLHVIQQKTGKELWIPIHPRLRRHLGWMRIRPKHRRNGLSGHILLNIQGDKWLGDSLRCAFKRRCAVVGIKDRQLHGIRKTTASVLAEIGCTPHQIMAITGHQTLKEVSNYTNQALAQRMGREAMAKWEQSDADSESDAT